MTETVTTGQAEVQPQSARHALILARTVNGLDAVLVAAREVEEEIATCTAALADAELDTMRDTSFAYRLPPVVRTALDGEFFEGHLLSAALRKDWLRIGAAGYFVTSESPNPLLLTAIKQMGER